MMIVSIKPKAGRLATGAYRARSPIGGHPFPASPVTDDTLQVQGGLVMPSDRTATVYKNPNSNFKDTATHQNTTAVMQVAANPTHLTETLVNDGDQHSVPEIMPHERGKFFPNKVTPVNKTQFGADGKKDANTAFHPKKTDVVERSQPVSAMAIAENEFLPSFPSNNNLWVDPNNSFLRNRANPLGNGSGSGRWETTKRSVV